MATSAGESPRKLFVVAVPPALAITVFGVIYGSLARGKLGASLTLVSSLLIFSGAVQFAVAALVVAGAEAGALVAAALVLNLRNLLLGAVLRPRLEGGPVRRALVAWFLTDESTGLALTGDVEAGRTLVTTGVMFYAAWQIGTLLGLAGASLASVVALAQATFPVLFIGLAALTCSTRGIAARALCAATLTIACIRLAPGLSAGAAIAAALAVSLPGRSS
jgi:predicted branched-subunit amino acid permease